MTRNLVRTGNSTALILSRDMKEHLGITDTVDVQIEEGRIILRKPLSFEEATARSDQKFANAYKELAK
jgi:antitoxin component of MazEF toxin-antitoxin module